ncbi:MAG: 23S rRNA (adenine(2503)-C(2))-methyltransferase RlmN [Nitrospiraceae bacterium]|nr:23S rRNA (adenine(2503)-C(2))-methyltransferase RlmN [Nitrospiraceae bacterium]
MAKINLKSLNEEEIKEFIKSQGLPDYRGGQILHWIYEKKAESMDQITEFSKELRKKLSSIAYISNLNLLEKQTSKDNTEKFLFKLEDDESIESILIPDEERLTLCISSQAGCAMGCRFCLTGKIGFKRNLMAHEIVDQVIYVSRVIAKRKKNNILTNIVFMGMGEPLANLAEVVEALHRLIRFMGISRKRITLSTSGIAAKIAEFYEHAPKVNLAVSLNAADDETRNKLMPINRIYPIKMLLDECRKLDMPARDKITFEYVMVDGINDKPEDAKKLVRLLKGIPSKVNIIPFNKYHGTEFKKPSDEKIFAFQKILMDGNINAFIRKSKGQDILAACGQLKAGYKTNK